MAAPARLSPHDRRFLASIVHQVWRACQVFVTVAMEQGLQQARAALDDLAEWAAFQRNHLTPRSTQRPKLVTPPALRVGREMLDDVDTICRRALEILDVLEQSALDNDEVEEEALGLIEGILSWTGMMARQLGITRNLRPQTLWFER